MSAIFLVAAFLGTFLATVRSLGWGFLAVIAVGYFNGVIRANFLSVLTTFMFDAAVLGLYLGYLRGGSRSASGGGSPVPRRFVMFLIGWPSFLCLVPINHFLVQCVALRATVWYLPVLLIAARLNAKDLALMARGLMVLNLAALAGGIYVFQNGVEALFPRNAVTHIIYASKDVGRFHRVPSIFLNAHGYGGTMLLTLPFLVGRLIGAKARVLDRMLAAVGVVAAAGGMLICGARSPLVVLILALLIAWVLSRFSLAIGLVGVVLIAGGLKFAGTSERFQRAASLQDTEAVEKRIEGSVHGESVIDLFARYPIGAGMGSSFGTSIPYFLADVAPEPVGLENEYCRILVDQGWPGLAGWLAFLFWLFLKPPPTRPPSPWRFGVVFMYSLAIASWGSALIGAGTLSAVPGSVLLLTEMGVLAGVRTRGEVPAEPGDHQAASPSLGFSSTLSPRGSVSERKVPGAYFGPASPTGLGPLMSEEPGQQPPTAAIGAVRKQGT